MNDRRIPHPYKTRVVHYDYLSHKLIAYLKRVSAQTQYFPFDNLIDFCRLFKPYADPLTDLSLF